MCSCQKKKRQKKVKKGSFFPTKSFKNYFPREQTVALINNGHVYFQLPTVLHKQLLLQSSMAIIMYILQGKQKHEQFCVKGSAKNQ